MSKCTCWMMLALLAALPVVAWADDEEPEKGDHETVEEPPPLADLREEHLAKETGPVDPIEYLHSFRDWLAEHEQAPPHTANDRVLYDVWRAALEPRARRMTRRVETMMTRKYWLPAIGTPERVNPKYWPRFIRELAGLYSELQGAWKQYEDPKIREGMNVRQVKRYWGYMGYGFPAARWRGAIHTRQAVGIGYGPVELYSYRNLMNRYRLGWGWRRQECYFCEERRRELQEKVDERVAERDRLIETTHDTLNQQMLSLQLLAAAMQAIEENELHDKFDQMPRESVLRNPAEDLLVTLRDSRLAAERYTGSSSAAYGQLLRGWLKTWKAAVEVIEKADVVDEEDEDSDDDADR